jgi:hypothetical protein
MAIDEQELAGFATTIRDFVQLEVAPRVAAYDEAADRRDVQRIAGVPGRPCPSGRQGVPAHREGTGEIYLHLIARPLFKCE